MRSVWIQALLLVTAASSAATVTGFNVRGVISVGSGSRLAPRLHAKKAKKKNTGGGGGGFGAKLSNQKSTVGTVSADKNSLEKQWDVFASITDLEVVPKDDQEAFTVKDVFVRCGKADEGGTQWFRIGKVVAGEGYDTDAALTLQKGLIFWTAVHMRREFVAMGGISGAAALELGFSDASMYMGSEEDGPVDADDEEDICIAERVSVKDVSQKKVGFRPDWNPPGFSYKRRENDAMKKKMSALDEIEAAGTWDIGG